MRAPTQAHQRKLVESILVAIEAKHGRARMITRFEPMEELVCCILSQHSTDAKSFPAFTLLRETFATWQDVVDAGEEAVAKVIWDAGLGNQKARSILGALTEIKRRFGEYTLEPLRAMPMLEARAWMLSLPGVGPKTASLVLCFCFGMGTIPVDTHVYRVGWRLGFYPETLGEAKAHDEAMKFVSPELAWRFHAGLIQHGRVTCRAPLPLCHECTVSQLCAWYQTGGPAKRRAQLGQDRRSAAHKVKKTMRKRAAKRV